MQAGVRKTLEEIFTDVVGRHLNLEIVLDASLAPPPETEQIFSFEEFSTPDPAPAKAAEPKGTPPAEKAPDTTKAVLNEDFYNDPLIQAALEKFKATLVKSG
jgi:DNA polymerase-3 subunit gamma/tau